MIPLLSSSSHLAFESPPQLCAISITSFLRKIVVLVIFDGFMPGVLAKPSLGISTRIP